MSDAPHLLLLRGHRADAGSALARRVAAVVADLSDTAQQFEDAVALSEAAVRASGLGIPCVVILDPDVPAPLATARRIAASASEVRFVLVAAPGDEARLRHEAIYAAPSGGRLTVTSATDPALRERVIAEITAVRQQRRFRTTLHRMKVRLSTPAPVDPGEYRRLLVSDRYLANVLQHAHDAIVSLDPAGRVASWNDGARELFGLAERDAVGQPFRTMFLNPNVAQAFFDAALEGATQSGRLEIGDADVRYVDANFSALDDPAGGRPGVVAILRDVTEQQRAEEELREASRQKDEFLAMLAHELRNPLAPIRNATQILQMLECVDPRIHSATAVIKRQADHLGALLDDLLDVARVTRGAVTLERESVPVEAIVVDAVEQARGLIDAKQHRFSMEGDASSLHVFGDRKRLVQVVSNLVVNAAKYTPHGGAIRLAVGEDADCIVIEVSDTGIGIEPRLLERIFDLFVQHEQTLDRSYGGLGIGLALARSLVSMHGGSITASSPGPDQGSTFTLRLPKAARTQAGNPDTTLVNAPVVSNRLSLMIVDDNTDAAETLAILLRAHGFETEVETRPLVALKRATVHMPDVLILDIGMPELDGYELARHLRSVPGHARPLLIALTGYGSANDQERARDAGFDHHFTKPVDPVALSGLLADEAIRRRDPTARSSGQ